MSFTSAGVQVWDPSQPFSIHGASSALAASINTKVNGSFADTAARDTAYAGLSSSQKQGIRCWIVNREGFQYWDPTAGAWEWDRTPRLLYHQELVHSVTPNTETGLLGTGTLTLPPGNRWVKVTASTLAVNGNSNANCYHKVQVQGDGISGDGGLMAGFTVTGGGQVSLARTWERVVASGSVEYTMTGRVSGPNGTYYFEGSQMTVIDVGPA